MTEERRKTAPPKGGQPQRTRRFGWEMLKGKWAEVIIYVALIIVILGFRPPLPIIIILVATFVTLKAVLHKQTITKWITSLIVLGLLFSIMIGISYFVGGTLSVIITHVALLTLIFYSKRKIIRDAFKEMFRHARYMAEKQKRYKEWQKTHK